MAESSQTATAPTRRGIRDAISSVPIQETGRVGNYVVYEAQDDDRITEDVRSRAKRTRGAGEVKDVYHASDDQVPFIPTGVIYITFLAEASAEARQQLLARYGLERLRTETDGSIFVQVRGGEDAVQVTDALRQEPIVAFAEPSLATEIEYRGFTLPDDELLAKQWHLQNKGPGQGGLSGLAKDADARVVAAWELNGFGSAEVVIGIIDDGFDLSHPDLTSRVVHPGDFAVNIPGAPPKGVHGTRCSGMAIGARGGGKIIGCAPDCGWMPVRQGVFSDDDIVQWFDHVQKNGASVICCSWGAKEQHFPLDPGSAIYKKIAECAKEGRGGKGCVIVFAAGNKHGPVNDPVKKIVDGFVCHPDVIAVTASTSIDKRALYSNFGKEIWICAPSGDSGHPFPAPKVEDITTSDTGRGYIEGFLGGTSGACALVAGVCGLILSANPHLTAPQVKDILKSSARQIDKVACPYDANGHSIFLGHGCVDAHAAVQMAINFPIAVA